MMSIETTDLQESDAYAAVAITTLGTARAAIAGLGEAAPCGAVRGLDIAIAGLLHPGTAMVQIAGDLSFVPPTSTAEIRTADNARTP